MKNKTGIFMLSIVVVVFFMILTATKSSASIKDNTISTQKIEDTIKNEEDAFILVGNRNCTSCQKFLPILEKAAKKTDTEVYYLDTENTSNKKFITSNNVTVTPTILVIKEGKLTRYEGALEYEATKNILERGEVK
ncbi:hypothetical protein A5821_002265 [Enterococcus sp. 7F3_DIV0205]|uniref:Thioredoxin domain-containing protein n=1 Tax=Candidatus Enterococcus palustris TaxID=1834189 RepID=A0AAQ3W9H6_9ENTE|nr:thioredoxin family protein [Enterococcus sp. 7F3_DIV0205]OTN82706.1 hypothetical protein A5821_002617 [Enterococcus sp. 7F3_DIV0205]